MKKITLTLFIIISSFYMNLKAQQISLSNFYIQNPYIFNPAATGIQSNLTAYFDYLDQWTGLKGAPETANIGAHGLVTESMGFGFQFTNTNQGIFRQNDVSLSYSYKLLFGERNSFSFGFLIGMHQNFINMSDIDENKLNDPAIYSNRFDEVLFKVGAGLYYNYENLKVHIASPVLYGMEEEKLFNNAFCLASYDFNFSDNIWLVSPSVVYRYSSYQYTFDGMITAEWNKKLTTQLGYRSNGCIITGFGIKAKGLNFSYIYEINRTDLNVVAKCSHQIFISYESPFSIINKKKLTNIRSN